MKLLLITTFIALDCRAAEPPNSSYTAYRLQHVRAADLERTLSPLLAREPGARVLVDSDANQLLVSGPAPAHRIARELISRLDRVTRADHAAPPAQNRTATRPAAAPARQLNLAPTATRPTATAQRPAAATRFATEAVAVENAPVASIEKLLIELFGPRLVAIPEAPAYTLALGRSRAELEIDSRGNRVIVHGTSTVVWQLSRLIAALDSPPPQAGSTVRVMPLVKSDPRKVQQAIEAYGGRLTKTGQSQRGRQPGATTGDGAQRSGSRGTTPATQAGDSRVRPASAQAPTGARQPLALAQFQEPADAPDGAAPPEQLGDQLPADAAQPGAGQLPGAAEERPANLREQLRELGADVDVEALEDLDILILRGRERDVQELMRIIQEIERISAQIEPTIQVYELKHAGSDAVAKVIAQIQPELLTGRQGRVSVTALVQPNALLLIGWGEAIKAVTELVEKLDQPVSPETQFRVFRLEHAAAGAVRTTLEDFYKTRTGLGAKVTVTADQRSNSLVVQASPRDLAEIELLVKRLDTPGSEAVNQLRVFRLQNTLAADLAPVIEEAISGRGRPGVAPGGAAAANERAAVLEFFTVDQKGRQLLKSGALADVRITPDPRANTLLVSAPAESMALLEALIEALDSLPATTAQIKVFHIENGDAARLMEMLQNLLGVQSVGQGGPQLAGAEGEGSLAPLRFSVDTRTNSIIATGAAGDLTIVEAILLRLDDSDVQERKSAVYRLKNSPSIDVARAVNDFLRSERLVERAAPGGASPFQQIEREVVVVAEPVSNSLILSATPRYFDDIRELIERLDAQPPQVMIQVLIGEVRLSNTEEFGVELGLQDSILFDRSVLQNISGGVTSTATTVPAGQLSPGYNFNQSQTTGPPLLGNAGTIPSLITAPLLGAQGVTNFATNRANGDLGFGGLVLSASSESVSILVRALRESSRLQVLSRPQVMTLDNQPAFIQVGQRVPRVTNVVSNALTGINSAIELMNVGLILGVTPRISPDGTVVMELDAERSALGPISEGIPIAVSPLGIPVLSPRVDTTVAQTTISAADGQTVVLGGLITKTITKKSRRVPYLSDIPLVGMLFRYDFDQVLRSELLIILTPHVIRNEADANAVKQAEAARISWCLADVERIQGPTGIYRRGESEIDGDGTVVVYPDQDLRGTVDRPVILPDLIPEGPNLVMPEEGMLVPGEELLVPPAQVPPGMEAPVTPVPMGPIIPGPSGAAPGGGPGMGAMPRTGGPTASAAPRSAATGSPGILSFGAPAESNSPVYTQVTLGAPRPRTPGSTQFVKPRATPPAARSTYVVPGAPHVAAPIGTLGARAGLPTQRPPVMQADGRIMVSGRSDSALRPDAGRYLPKPTAPGGQ
ncbi:MAG: hypothetical protein K2Y37_13245 [Pirellulales bacterium]|nr:hypothetical protein [Pirellulales bacterium]